VEFLHEHLPAARRELLLIKRPHLCRGARDVKHNAGVHHLAADAIENTPDDVTLRRDQHRERERTG
jgi:hypothetical protein